MRGFLRRLLDLLDETDAVYKHGVIVVRHALEQNRMIARRSREGVGIEVGVIERRRRIRSDQSAVEVHVDGLRAPRSPGHLKVQFVDAGHLNSDRLADRARTLDKGCLHAIGISGRLYGELSGKHYPITMIAQPPIDAVEDLPYRIQRDRILLQKSVVFGQSRWIVPAPSETNQPLVEHPLGVNTEKLLLKWIEKSQPGPFLAEFGKLLSDCERRECPQIKLEGVLKRVVQLFQQTNPWLNQTRMLEIELEIDEIVSSSYKYSSIYEGMSVILDQLFHLVQAESRSKEDQSKLALGIERYILNRYTELLSLPSIAEYFGITPATVSSLFKKYKGIPPMEFMIRLRIEKAKELLRIVPPLTIRDVAAAIGYEDPYYMSRLFKSVTGMSPSEFRDTR